MRSRMSGSPWISRTISIVLALCILSSSTPAAVQTIVAVTGESSVTFAFWFHTSGLAKILQGRSAANPHAQEKQRDRDARIVRLQIFPDNASVDLGDHVRFSAVAFDQDGNTLGGIKIKWSGKPTPSQRVRISQHGEFEATAPGSFIVAAEANGRNAQSTVVVRSGAPRNLNLPPTGVQQVSTRDLPSSKVSSIETKGQPHASRLAVRNIKSARDVTRRSHSRPAAAPVPFLPGDGWSNDNYWSADDPGNGVGNPPGAPLDGGAGSGNFQFSAPVLSLPGRGINLALGLAYNSRLWNKAGTQINYDNDRGWPAPGFSLGFGKLLGMGVNGGGMLIDADGTRHAYTGQITFYNWGTYGVMHTTDGSFIDYTYWTGAGGGITSAQARLANGTVIAYGAPGPGAVYPTSIEDANGNIVTITYVNNSGPRIQTINDTLNRPITFSYDSSNLLTAITVPGLNGGANRTAVRLHYHQLALGYGFSGLTASVRDANPWILDAVYYPATGTGYWLNDSDSYSSYGMLAKVVEERNMGFSASSLNDMGNVWPGSITRSELYNYPLSPDYSLTDAPTYTSMTESWTRDGVNFDSATTSYEVHENETPRRTIITLPNGTKSKQLATNAPNQWNDGLVFHDETYVTEGQPLQSSDSSWQQGAYDSPRPTRVEKRDERGQMTAAEFSYGNVYNQLIEVRDFDYGGTAPLRYTRTAYQNSSNYMGRHIFNLPLSVEIYDADTTTRLSRTEYQYDGQTLSPAAGVVQHDQASNPYAADEGFCYWDYDWSDPDCGGGCPPDVMGCDGYCPQIYYCPYVGSSPTDYRGNVTQVTSYADAVNLTGAVSETRRYDITGNLVSASTSCCEQTSFSYTTNTQYAYPESKTRGSATDPLAQVTASAVYDFNTGLGSSATDANGRPSQTNYDANTLRPTTTISSTGAHADYAYDDAAMTITATTFLAASEGGGMADQSVKLLNGMGQVRQEKARGPDNGQNQTWDAVDTIYNNLGQVYQQSRPYRVGSETPVYSTATYDVLGRTARVTAPDGSFSETYYNEQDFDSNDSYTPTRPNVASSDPGETTLVRDAWGRERWGRTDSSGRLVEVVEPNPNGNGSVAASGLVTTYAYNTLGNLTTVTQGAQTRSFAYDSLGRLTAQKLAEQNPTLDSTGTYQSTGGTWSDVFTYDNRSNLISRTDARGVKTKYSYLIGDDPNQPDPLNRLQSVSWDTNGFGDTTNPIFAAAPVTYQYRQKTVANDAMDVTELAGVTTSGVSTESFGHDTEGRVSSKTLTLSSRISYPFLTEYIYDSLDRPTDVRYPAEYGNGAQPRKVVHQNYDIASRLTSLTYDGQSFASNIVYNSASQTTSLNVGTGTNQISESYSYNSQTGLLDSQTVARGATTLLNLSYDYTNAGGKRTGQLTKILNNLNHNKDRGYSYDALGRLVQATGGPASSTLWTQTYSYDRYGNRLSVSANGNSARNESRGGSSTVSERLAANSIARPSEPKVDLPTDLLARNTSIELSSSARDGSKPISDAPPALRAPTTPQSGPPTFTDDPLQAGATPIKAVHITELRAAIDALRQRRGFSAYSWQYSVTISDLISANPIIEMRTALDQAIGVPPNGYAAGLAQGQPVLAIHIQELRQRVTDNWNGGCLTIDQYIKNFYQGALARQPNQNELQSWTSQLRQAYYQGQLLSAVKYMGRQLFKSTEYANRGRDNHWYVYDIYWAYLQRQPDTSGWNFWEGIITTDNQNGIDGREHVRVAFESDTIEFAPKIASLCVGSSGSSPIPLDGLASLSYNAANNHITTAGFAYDAAGNQTRVVRTDGSTQQFQYDAANRLIQVRDGYGYVLETFTYGDSNERLISDENGYRTYFDCDGGTTIAEYYEASGSTTPSWSKSYVYLGGRLLSTLIPNGAGGEATQFHHPDRLGTRLVTDPAAGTSFEQVGLPFGTAIDAESSGATNRRFTSYDRSPTTGLDYAVNRHYDSQQGRFTQVDPIGVRASSRGNPQSFNLYSYCGNDPINRVDPSGLFWGKLWHFVKKAVQVAVAVIATVLAIVTLNPQFLTQAIQAWIDVFGGWGRILGRNAKWLQFFPSGLGASNTVQARGTPPWNSNRPPFFQFQDGPIYTCHNPPDCQDEIPPLVFGVEVPIPSSILSRMWAGIRSAAGSVNTAILGGALTAHYYYQRYDAWMQRQTDRALNQMAENSKLVQIGTYPNGEPIYFGGGAAGLEEDLLPSNARTFTNPEAAFSHLEDFHGIDPILASERLHQIKAQWGLGPAENVSFDRTGGVWDAATGRYLGSLTQGGGKRVR